MMELETGAMIYIIAVVVLPLLLGALWLLISSPDKYYYKYIGPYILKIDIKTMRIISAKKIATSVKSRRDPKL